MLVAILNMKVAQPVAANLISLSPLRGASLCEVTWLWLEYFLLYRGNKNPDGRMEGRSDGRQLLSCSLLRRNMLATLNSIVIAIMSRPVY